MSEIAQGMIRDAIGAFIHDYEKMARDVIARDDEVDELNAAIFDELVAIMTRDPETVSLSSGDTIRNYRQMSIVSPVKFNTRHRSPHDVRILRCREGGYSWVNARPASAMDSSSSGRSPSLALIAGGRGRTTVMMMRKTGKNRTTMKARPPDPHSLFIHHRPGI